MYSIPRCYIDAICYDRTSKLSGKGTIRKSRRGPSRSVGTGAMCGIDARTHKQLGARIRIDIAYTCMSYTIFNRRAPEPRARAKTHTAHTACWLAQVRWMIARHREGE